MSADRAGRRLGEVLDSGADDFIPKPPEAAELHARLRVVERGLSLQRRLIRDADTDGLTHLFGRHGFTRRARDCLAAIRPPELLTALMIDIDRFKAINDRHGHDGGDRVIRAVADVLKETGALTGRIGGEEFAVLMPGHGLGGAGVVAERIRATCARLRVPGLRGPIRSPAASASPPGARATPSRACSPGPTGRSMRPRRAAATRWCRRPGRVSTG